MKTERMVLLVTPEEKSRIAAESAKLGVSASEYVRKLVSLLDADDVGALEDLRAMMPAVEAALDNIERNLERSIKTLEQGEARRAYYDSEAYRTEIREQVVNDPDIDWEAARRFFGKRQAA